jgi:transcription elongation factor Elf1
MNAEWWEVTGEFGTFLILAAIPICVMIGKTGIILLPIGLSILAVTIFRTVWLKRKKRAEQMSRTIYTCLVCGWSGKDKEFLEDDKKDGVTYLICPQCRCGHFLWDDDELKHRVGYIAILDDVKAERKARKITRIPENVEPTLTRIKKQWRK